MVRFPIEQTIETQSTPRVATEKTAPWAFRKLHEGVRALPDDLASLRWFTPYWTLGETEVS